MTTVATRIRGGQVMVHGKLLDTDVLTDNGKIVAIVGRIAGVPQ